MQLSILNAFSPATALTVNKQSLSRVDQQHESRRATLAHIFRVQISSGMGLQHIFQCHFPAIVRTSNTVFPISMQGRGVGGTDC